MDYGRHDTPLSAPRPHTHTHTQTHKYTAVKRERKKDCGKEKNLDPSSGLCVGTGEQFVLQNSHYQLSAEGLQLAAVVHSVAQPNMQAYFFSSLPLFVNMHISLLLTSPSLLFI